MKYYLREGWQFLSADCFPRREAESSCLDAAGRSFYDPDYEAAGWEEVTLPHTFNDRDLFAARIQDAGSGQKRTCVLYRRFFTAPEKYGARYFLAFEGVRQAAYVYVNGTLAGFSENGTAPFAFDITPYVKPGERNLIAVTADNTSSRNIPCCIAETPNHPDAVPGSFLFPQDAEVPDEIRGVGFQWNCNDFNPSVGGLTRPVCLYIKEPVYLALPFYSNLMTSGAYVYGSDFADGRLKVHVQAEAVNVSGQDTQLSLTVHIRDLNGYILHTFSSASTVTAKTSVPSCPLTITPPGAYRKREGGGFLPVPEEEMPETTLASRNVTRLEAVSGPLPLALWSLEDPRLYRVEIVLFSDGREADREVVETGFRQLAYDRDRGVLVNGIPVWLSGYAQRSSNEWPAIGIAPEWLKDFDMQLVRESGANHIRFMHVAASPADIRSCDRNGIAVTQPAGDKEAETFGRQWAQRLELMRDVIIAFRNHPSIFFWEAGNNSISQKHMAQMRRIREALDPMGGRFMGCRTINTEDVLAESEYVGTMLNRHAARFLAEHGPVTETEYSREEAPRRIWDDFTPPDFDYPDLYIGKGGKKQVGRDFYDLTMEELCLAETKGYAEFFFDRIGGSSGKNWYSACAALCWTDSAQHGRQSFSENGRMSGRVDAARIKKQNFGLYQVLQSPVPKVYILGHWNYPADSGENYRYPLKRFNGQYFEETGETARRDPRRKTVYAAGSYSIARTELYINGRLQGSCDTPEDGFLFPFPDVDITQSGEIKAIGYPYPDGNETPVPVSHSIVTAGEPSMLSLSLHTAPGGLRADGGDIAFIDISILDRNGNLCPLCNTRVDFSLNGDAVFLGGYTSGCFDLTPEEKRENESLSGAPKPHRESVIHKPYVYTECGTSRVFLRAGKKAGPLHFSARTADIPPAFLSFESIPGRHTDLDSEEPAHCYPKGPFPENTGAAALMSLKIPAADAVKYTPEAACYCKVLVNGQEPDTRGVRSVNENGTVWGAVLCILERMKNTSWKEDFTFRFDREAEELCVTTSSGTILSARSRKTHLLVDGKENLMDGEPYLSPEGQFVMEISAIVPWLPHTSCRYDEKVNVLRIERT